MAAVILAVRMSGTRNGDDWPPMGSVMDLPGQEAADLEAAGIVIRTSEPVDLPVEQSEELPVEQAVAPEGETAVVRPRGRKA